MLYFIPAWYQENQWCENEQKWYVRRTHTEFDDTVKQIQLFHRSKAYPYKIILLSFAPNFRHFIHRQSVFHAPYWSCFDAIQEIRRKKVRILSFHDIKWPEGVEYIYSPFAIIVMLHDQKYAQIEFGEDGNPIQIDMFEKDLICRRNLYDDRGFVSATIVYIDGKPSYQDYLMENGIRKMRLFYVDGHVEINQNYPNYLLQYENQELEMKFSRLEYSSIDEIIREVLASYVKQTKEQDIFCAAMHKKNEVVLKSVLKGKKTILTFFENRYKIQKDTTSHEMLKNADYIITDSQENTEYVKKNVEAEIYNITDITPYDSRADFGISQQLNVQKILVPIDHIEDELFMELIHYLGKYMLLNKNVRIHLFTREFQYNRKEQILEKTRNFLEMFQLETQWAREENPMQAENGAFNDMEEVESEEVPIRFYVEQCVDELSVSKCIREQRIIVDLRNIPELYLRIAGLSVGIPQILRYKTKYVQHGKNGFILKDVKKLPEVLKFYLGSLNNWNEAMVYSYELGRKYTTDVLVDKWKEVIDFIEKDSSITIGRV